jgi:hypothetical protein
MAPAPTAFISYAWENGEHCGWVREFAARLRRDGIDAKIDQWETALGDQLPAFMEGAIANNDFVLIICTPKYRLRSDQRKGGVGYEGDIMSAEVFSKKNHRKFIPLLRSGDWDESAPSWLRGKRYADFRGDPPVEREYESLLSTLHGRVQTAPPLGPAPPSHYLEPSEIGDFGDAADFEQQSKMLLGNIKSDERLSPILNGVYLPICLPKCRLGDYGRLVDELFLPRVKMTYEGTFTNARFENSMSGKLSGQLAIARDSRQERLIEKMATGPVVGILFPVALQGYSVQAAREQMASLPEGFTLAGVLDTCVAFLAYPDVLAADHAPTLVCAGTTWQSAFSLCFHPGLKFLSFSIADEAYAIGSFSPGLLYI